jgi:hypothetical protein
LLLQCTCALSSYVESRGRKEPKVREANSRQANMLEHILVAMTIPSWRNLLYALLKQWNH